MAEINKNTQSRKWLLTINNPGELWTHDIIKNILLSMKSVVYWCMADEIGLKKQTPHTHVFLYSRSGIRFSTVKNKFPEAHIDYCRGTCEDNMHYISKTGKWEGNPKEDTSIPGTFEESGEIPMERPGQRNDLVDLYSMIKSGMSDYEILEDMPDAIANIERLDKVRQILKQEQFKSQFRDLQVTYIYGAPGTGKTRSVMDQYGYGNVYRVTDYLHPFDGYSGQDVIVFEEFRSSLPLVQMLTLLDGYPLELPCRYNNKQACYTKVYVITNISITNQYQHAYHYENDSWLAFVRRFQSVVRYDPSGKRYFDIKLVQDGFSLEERESEFD